MTTLHAGDGSDAGLWKEPLLIPQKWYIHQENMIHPDQLPPHWIEHPEPDNHGKINCQQDLLLIMKSVLSDQKVSKYKECCSVFW